MISDKKIAGLAILTLFLTLLTSFAAADPAQPPPPPPPEPPSGGVQNSYSPVTDIRTCSTGYDSGTNTLEYCNELYRQTKTKNIYYCDDNNNGQWDSGEAKGDYDNPTPAQNKCANGGSYGLLETEQRTFMTCGKNDAENTNTMKTTSVSDEWFCPSAKGLSMRHEAGTLDAGIGVSSAEFPGSIRDGENMSFNVKAAVPACVNRVPMINMNVQMRDPHSGEVTDKSGIYAAHMNLYYGPGGSKAQVREVELPEQDAYRRQYTTNIESHTYRMWAFRQRFAGAVQESVGSQNLQLPRDADVSEIAEDYRDSGKSVGDLWLSSDFLYGAEAGEPNTRTVEVTRTINSTCTQDVKDISERDFESGNDFINWAENNKEEAIDLLGKKGGNYCGISANQTMTAINGVERTGGLKQKEEELTGFISTKILDNETGEIEASVDVRDLNATFLNESGETEDLETAEEFMYFYGNDEDDASQELKDSSDSWNTGWWADTSGKTFTEISNVENSDGDSGDLDATVDVRDLNVTFVNEEGDSENLTTVEDFEYYYDENEEEAISTLVSSKSVWESWTDLSDKRIDEIKNIHSDGTHVIELKADYTEITYDVVFEATYTSYMTGEEFDDYDNYYIEEQLEKHVYGADNSLSDAVKPEDRFENKQVKVGGVLESEEEDQYEGKLRLETVENVAKDRVYIYYTYRKNERAKKSWNWRALQGITMTTLAKCMYNWEDCMNNERDLSSRSWDGHEVYDAGYGPWEKTNTFNWSATAAQNKGEELQGVIDDTDKYNESLEISFDKYYDGARGSTSRQATPINVYRTCESDMGWTSAEGEFYNEDHFICPDSGQTNQEGDSVNPSTVYRCKNGAAQLPAESAEEYTGVKKDGNWYVCREMSPPAWHKDQGPPEVYLQKQRGENTETAQIICEDEVATCEEESYRMKIYDPGDQPLECPESYEAYDTEASSKEIGSHKYVCAAAKDKVGKEGFSARPVEFGADAETQNLNAELLYSASTVKIPYGQSTHLFYSVTNNADVNRDVRVSLNGVNATFTDGTESKSFTLVEDEVKELEIDLQPAFPGNGTFWVETTDETVGYKLNNTINVRAPSQIGGVAQGEEESVPGIGLVHIMVLAAASAAYFLISRP